MISLDCLHCGAPFLTATPRQGQDLDDFRAAWKLTAQQHSDMFTCAGCGGQFELQDDGIDTGQGGSVDLHDVSKPRIDSLNVGSGAPTGGNALFIFGSALDVGTLVVKFGGKVSPEVSHRTATQARVVVPGGQYTLLGPTFTSGTFMVGEEVVSTSGARGAVKSLMPFVVDNPTRAFLPNEEVTGTISGAKLTTSNPAYSGAVDVTVENENGQRSVGGAFSSYVYV